MDDLISRQDAIDALRTCYETETISMGNGDEYINYGDAAAEIEQLPSARPERLSDDDFETIRIHLNAYKENLCNQRRWKEAEEYQRIIDRFMAFASAQSTIEPRAKGHWIKIPGVIGVAYCSECNHQLAENGTNFCPNCGADMREETK